MHRRALRLPGAVAATALVGASLALTLPRSVELAQPPSAEPAFAAFVNGHGIQRVASTNGPVIGFLLGEDRSNARFVESFVSDVNDLHSLETSGYTHFATEMQMYVIPLGLNEFQRFEQVDPVFAAPNGNDAWFLGDILEHSGVGWGDWNRILQHYERFREPATQLRLYAFDDLFPPRRG